MRNPPPIKERFWQKVKKQKNGCWEWLGTKTSEGYGTMSVTALSIYKNSTGMLAHHISWYIENGCLPKDCILHHCDNRLCVNPKHLFEGSKLDNSHDCIRKHRHFSQRKTHCPKGHEYNGENTRIYDGRRFCRVCDNIRNHIRRNPVPVWAA